MPNQRCSYLSPTFPVSRPMRTRCELMEMNRARWYSYLDADDANDATLIEDLQRLRQKAASERSKAPASSRFQVARVDLPLDEDADDVAAATGGESNEDLSGACSTQFDDPPLVDAATGEPLRDLSNLAVWNVSTAKPGNGVEQLLSGSRQTYWQSDGPQPHSISAQFSSKVKICEVRLLLSFTDDESYTPAIVSIRVGSSFHDLRVVRRNKELNKPDGWVRIPLGLNSIEALEDWNETDSLPSGEEDLQTMTPGELAERDQRRRVRSENRRREVKSLREQESPAKELSESKANQRVHSPLATGVSSRVSDEAVATEKFRLSRRDRNFVRAHMLQIVIHTNHQNGRDSHVRQVKVLGPTRQVAGGDTPRFSSSTFKMYEEIR